METGITPIVNDLGISIVDVLGYWSYCSQN